VGASWIFTRSGNTWTQQGSKLVGDGCVSLTCYQGWAIALNQAGSTLAIGGIADDDYVGATWVFTSSNGTWTQQGQKLVGTGGATGANEQGGALALSGTGNVLVVGGPADNRNQGAVWVWTRTNGVWDQQGEKLIGTGDPGPSDLQGSSVSISTAGGILAFGGPYENSGEGAAWVFARNENNVWEQQGEKLVGTGGTGLPSMGYSVALSNDANTLVMGGNTDNLGKGATWVFKGPNVPSPSPTPPTTPVPTPTPTPPTPSPSPTPTPSPEASTSGLTSGQKAVVAIIVIIALILLGGVGYYYHRKRQQGNDLGGPLAAADTGTGAPGPASTTSFQSFQEAVDD
jgi:cell division septation protein DedD